MNENPRNSVVLSAGTINNDRKSWIEVFPTAEKVRNGPWFFTITRADLDVAVASIAEKAGRAQIDYDHKASEGDSRAAGWFTGKARVIEAGAATPYGLPAPKDSVWAEVEWTPQAVQEIRDGVFKFVSAEWAMHDVDAKTGLRTKFKEWVAATLTNRPFFKDLAPVQATATVDVTRIWNEELERLAKNSPDGLLPISVATRGAKNCADDVTRLLEERGQQRYGESEWRSALREVFRRLTDNQGDVKKRSPNLAREDHMSSITATYEPDAVALRAAEQEFDLRFDAIDEDSVRVHARATEILRASGILLETPDEYVAAVSQARRELTPVKCESIRGYTHDESLDLHVEATKILRSRGVYLEDETEELYASALAEAETLLAVDLKGNR